ncbi:MAG: class I SAM-dependent methyltransferase [Candidatus Omnitrophica bacterium]|nr:class I SAM-dependent methyltransferase [Candidatus Omnitrophota bacterium]
MSDELSPPSTPTDACKDGFNPEYFDRLADLEQGHFWFVSRNRLIVWAIRKYFPDMRDYLELGCGTGFVLAAVRRAFGDAALSGCDLYPEGVDWTRRRVPGAEVAQMDVRTLSDEGRFDVVGAYDLMEHIPEDGMVLSRIHRALKKDGILVMTVPQHRFLWGPFDEASCHCRRYTESMLRERVETAGFEILRMTSFVSLLLPLMSAARLMEKRRPAREYDLIESLKPNSVANAVFSRILDAERLLIRMGVSPPAGGSLLAVAKKK